MPDTTTLSAPETAARPRVAPSAPAGLAPLVRPARDREPRLGEMLGRSRPMRELFRRLERAGRDSAPVLLEGETGAGKDLAAQTLHSLCHPPSALFLTFDPDHRPTEAECAVGGTLFVEEVGELPAEVQHELWQALCAAALPAPHGGRLAAGLARGAIGTIGAIGAIGRRGGDPGLRLVCATARDLRSEVERGRFRPDLYRVLRAGAIAVPSLRERRDDLPLLIDHFLAAACRRHDRRPVGLRPDTLQLLLAHPWDGNVRELRNELERAVLLTPDGDEVRPHALSPDLAPAARLTGAAPGSLRQRSRELEKTMVAQALSRNGWNVAATARELGISRVGLSKKLRALEMKRPRRWPAAEGADL